MDNWERSRCTTQQDARPRDVEEKAIVWIDTLEASVSHARRRDFVEWLRESPQHVTAVLRLMTLQRALRRFDYRQYGFSPGESVSGNVVGLARPSMSITRASHPAPVRLRRSSRRAAATAILGLMAGVGVWQFEMRSTSVYETEVGESQAVILSDGSRIVLNTDSELKVRYTPWARTLRLERGEADFAVAAQPNRPFTVAAGESVVRALGTRFSIRLHAMGRSAIVVSEGRVAIGDRSGNETLATLAARDRASYDGRLLLRERLSAEEVEQHQAWLSGRLYFKGETLAEVVDELNRYNRRQLILRNPLAAAHKISGTFWVREPDALVAMLPSTLPTMPDAVVFNERGSHGKRDR